jgi:ribosome-associated protein
MLTNKQKEIIANEVNFITSRSSGPGGQSVNKLNTKVEVRLDIENSEAFSQDEKNRIKRALSNRISKDHDLIIQSSEERSQLKNKETAINKLIDLLNSVLKVQKKRKKTRRPKSAIERRLKKKKAHAEKKSWRKPPQTP